jgi:hypothetical protein
MTRRRLRVSSDQTNIVLYPLITTNPHVLRSVKHSRTCDQSKWVFCVPVLFSLTRSRARYFCSAVRKRAVVGCAGRRKTVGMAIKTALMVSHSLGGRPGTYIAPEKRKMS